MHPPSPLPASRCDTPGLFKRLFCMAYEGLLLFAVLAIAFLPTPLIHSDAPWLYYVKSIYFVSIMGLYFTWFWTHGGQTLALKTWHLRITSDNGLKVSWQRAWLRYFVTLALIGSAIVSAIVTRRAGFPVWSFICIAAGAIDILWVLFDRDKQFLHDRISGTRLCVTTLSARRVAEGNAE